MLQVCRVKRDSRDVVMASRFCERCSRLLEQITTWLLRVCREVEQKVREVFRELCVCGCFRSTPEKDLFRRMTQELTPVQLLGSKSCHYLLSLFVVSNYVDNWTYRQTAFVILRLLSKPYDIWLNMNWNYINSVYVKLIAHDIHFWELWVEFFNDMFLLSAAQTQLFNQENLQALNRLANSENTEEQRMAALCYLHLSLHCE